MPLKAWVPVMTEHHAQMPQMTMLSICLRLKFYNFLVDCCNQPKMVHF